MFLLGWLIMVKFCVPLWMSSSITQMLLLKKNSIISHKYWLFGSLDFPRVHTSLHHSLWEVSENNGLWFETMALFFFKLIWIYPEVVISSTTSNFIVLHLCTRRGYIGICSVANFFSVVLLWIKSRLVVLQWSQIMGCFSF